jgi:hypothetical protein
MPYGDGIFDLTPIVPVSLLKAEVKSVWERITKMSPLHHSSDLSHQAYKFQRDRRHSKEAISKMPLSWFRNRFYLASGLSGYWLAEYFY